MSEYHNSLEELTSRRSILRAAGLTGMAAIAAGWATRTSLATDSSVTAPAMLTGGPTDGAAQFAAIPGRTIDEKILNFALTLEILEADLYLQALNIATGRPLHSPLSQNPGSYRRRVGSGGLDADANIDGFLYLVQFSYVEAAHRDFIRAAISGGGGTPVKPNPAGYKFTSTPPATIKGLLAALLPLEETGVRAYLGALPYFNDLGLATVAGTIYSTEARHSAVIQYELGNDPGPTKMPGDLQVTPNQPSGNTFEYYLKPKTVLTRASVYFA